MEGKTPRLGSILDDYCPKCRLLLDHAVQAMFEGEVQTVVCNTCMHSHPYKHGKLPKKRGAGKPSLFEQILSKRPPTQVTYMPTTKKHAGDTDDEE